jgi:hypothetical protein
MGYQSLWVIAAGLLFNLVVIGSFNAYIAHLKRVAPAPSVGSLDISSQDARKRFTKLDGRTNGFFLLLAMGVGTALYFVLHFIGGLRSAMLPPALMSFPISSAFFCLLALFLGVGIGAATTMPILRRWWPEDTAWYSTYLSVKRYGSDYDRLCHGMGMAVAALALLALPFGLNTYVQAREEGFVVHPFFGFHERTFAYSDIQGIEDAPRYTRNGTRWHYIVTFKDGQTWDSDNMPSGGRYESKQLIQLLAHRAGIKVKKDSRY